MAAMDPYSILEHPLSTEKAVREMEANNTIIFQVAKQSTKRQVKWAVEKEFGVKVTGVRTLISSKGKKRAYVKLHPNTPAMDVTSKLGLI